MAVSANRLELLQIADAVAREKSIDRQIVIQAMADAIGKAARSRYGQETDVLADIDARTGEIKLQRRLLVVESVSDVEDYGTQIPLELARDKDPDIQVGDYVSEPLPPMDFGRIAAQSAKQVIVQKVREAERDRQFEEYEHRKNEIVNGTVKRVEYGNVIVDLGRAEAIIRRDETIPRENFRYGDRVRAFICVVRREQRGPQIFLSRTRPEFMAKLFTMEVPEIYDGVIEIKSVARDPGSRAKIAVISRDSSIDPVGACVGMRGSRVQAVVGELQGEKIDIIPWSPDPASFIVNALQPAEVAKVVLDEEAERIDVVVRPLPAVVEAAPIIAGASLDAQGDPQLVLDPEALVRAVVRLGPRPLAASPARPLPILVVDDSLTTRMLEQSVLTSAGYDVDLATCGEEGLEMLRARRYGLALVDVEMPGIDGFEVVAQVRADPDLRAIPVILVTSRAADEDLRRGREAGADDYIVKGEFDQERLLRRIRELMR